jgi:hypothetical protein
MSQYVDPPDLDLRLADAVIAMTFDNDHDVLRWYEVLEEAHAEGTLDWSALSPRIAETAERAAFDRAAVEYFLGVIEASGQGATLVAELVGLRQTMPETYWSVYWWRYGEAESASEPADSMAWVPEPAAGHLTGAWGESWRDTLAEVLEERWGPGWQEHPDEHKAYWLTDLLPELTGTAETAAPVDEAPSPPDDLVAAEPVPAEELAEPVHLDPAPRNPVAAESMPTEDPEPDAAALREIATTSVRDAIAEIPDAEHLSPEVVEKMVQTVLARLQAS